MRFIGPKPEGVRFLSIRMQILSPLKMSICLLLALFHGAIQLTAAGFQSVGVQGWNVDRCLVQDLY